MTSFSRLKGLIVISLVHMLDETIISFLLLLYSIGQRTFAFNSSSFSHPAVIIPQLDRTALSALYTPHRRNRSHHYRRAQHTWLILTSKIIKTQHKPSPSLTSYQMTKTGIPRFQLKPVFKACFAALTAITKFCSNCIILHVANHTIYNPCG